VLSLYLPFLRKNVFISDADGLDVNFFPESSTKGIEVERGIWDVIAAAEQSVSYECCPLVTLVALMVFVAAEV
jgi:hypothetical protein